MEAVEGDDLVDVIAALVSNDATAPEILFKFFLDVVFNLHKDGFLEILWLVVEDEPTMALAKGLFNVRAGVLLIAGGTESMETLGSNVPKEELFVAVG